MEIGSDWQRVGVMGCTPRGTGCSQRGFELRVRGLDAHMPALLVKLAPSGPGYLTGGGEGPEGSLFGSVTLSLDRSRPPPTALGRAPESASG